MKRWRVPVEEYQYYGVYVYAESSEEAVAMVEKMIDNDEIKYDDEGDGDVRVVEDCVGEIDENGFLI